MKKETKRNSSVVTTFFKQHKLKVTPEALEKIENTIKKSVCKLVSNAFISVVNENLKEKKFKKRQSIAYKDVLYAMKVMRLNPYYIEDLERVKKIYDIAELVKGLVEKYDEINAPTLKSILKEKHYEIDGLEFLKNMIRDIENLLVKGGDGSKRASKIKNTLEFDKLFNSSKKEIIKQNRVQLYLFLSSSVKDKYCKTIEDTFNSSKINYNSKFFNALKDDLEENYRRSGDSSLVEVSIDKKKLQIPRKDVKLLIKQIDSFQKKLSTLKKTKELPGKTKSKSLKEYKEKKKGFLLKSITENFNRKISVDDLSLKHFFQSSISCYHFTLSPLKSIVKECIKKIKELDIMKDKDISNISITKEGGMFLYFVIDEMIQNYLKLILLITGIARNKQVNEFIVAGSEFIKYSNLNFLLDASNTNNEINEVAKKIPKIKLDVKRRKSKLDLSNHTIYKEDTKEPKKKAKKSKKKKTKEPKKNEKEGDQPSIKESKKEKSPKKPSPQKEKKQSPIKQDPVEISSKLMKYYKRTEVKNINEITVDEMRNAISSLITVANSLTGVVKYTLGEDLNHPFYEIKGSNANTIHLLTFNELDPSTRKRRYYYFTFANTGNKQYIYIPYTSKLNSVVSAVRQMNENIIFIREKYNDKLANVMFVENLITRGDDVDNYYNSIEKLDKNAFVEIVTDRYFEQKSKDDENK